MPIWVSVKPVEHVAYIHPRAKIVSTSKPQQAFTGLSAK